MEVRRGRRTAMARDSINLRPGDREMNTTYVDPATTSIVARCSLKTGSSIDLFEGGDDSVGPVDRIGPAVIVGQRFGPSDQLARSVGEACRTGDATALDSTVGCCSALVALPDGLSGFSDPVGQFPLFSARTDDQVVIGPSAAGVAADTGRMVDPLSVTAGIACHDIPDLFAERTMYVGVLRIPEGASIRVDAQGVTKSDYRRIRVDPMMRPSDVAEQVRHCLVESVRVRHETADQLATDFSGGLDSTALAFLAAAPGSPILALTSHNRNDDDIVRAVQYARLSMAIAHHVVPGSVEQLPFQERTCSTDEPQIAPLFAGPLRARLATAAQLGADLHLVGEGADTVLGAPPVYLADLARKGELTVLWRHCLGWARLRARSPMRLFCRAVALATTDRHRALLALARRIDLGRPAGMGSWEEEWIGYWNPPQANWLPPPGETAAGRPRSGPRGPGERH